MLKHAKSNVEHTNQSPNYQDCQHSINNEVFNLVHLLSLLPCFKAVVKIGMDVGGLSPPALNLAYYWLGFVVVLLAFNPSYASTTSHPARE